MLATDEELREVIEVIDELFGLHGNAWDLANYPRSRYPLGNVLLDSRDDDSKSPRPAPTWGGLNIVRT